jgi:hypothetical protein
MLTNETVSSYMRITRELSAAARNAARKTSEETGVRVAELNTLNAARFGRMVRAALAGAPADFVAISLEEVVSHSQAADNAETVTDFANQS